MWEIAKTAGIFIFLILCSLQDIKEKRISVKMLVLSGALFLILSLLFDRMPCERRIAGMLPGMSAFVLAFLTGEQIGYGDAACLAVLGTVVSFDILFGAMTVGLLILSIYSLVLLIRRKADRRTTLPFVPFLTVGMLWRMLVQKG